MPITPRGTRRFTIRKPFGRSIVSRVSPIGSSKSTTCFNPSAIPSILSLLRARRSSNDSEVPLSLPRCKSSWFASMISLLRWSNACAATRSAAFFCSVDRLLRMDVVLPANSAFCLTSLIINTSSKVLVKSIRHDE
ncbi:hypothetical protein D3C78_1314920 [compost metagenome]